ncbi:MAG: MCE family protein [Alphaproteobacteria bacterium]|nr:MCE family protein [Alphaproteobacteria bacterium]
MAAKRRDKSTIESLAGALTIAALAALFAFSYTVDSRAGSGYALTARYQSVDGLIETAPVWLAGMRVGTVERIAFDAEFREAVVTMRIDRGIKLPDDTSAAIMSQGLLGGKYVFLSPGGSPDAMADGDEFQFVQNSVIMEQVLQLIVRGAEKRAEARKAEKAAREAGQGGAPSAPKKP